MDPSMTRMNLFLVALLALLPAAASAQQSPRPLAEGPRPAAYEALMRCRAITEATARLQCFDTATAELQAATERRELVVVDRAQVREGRRRLFGLSLPHLPIFGGGDDANDNDADRVDHVEGVISSAHTNATSQWVIRLQDGAVWTQIDGHTLGNPPRSGMPVLINRAAMGSFMMRVDGQPGIRVRRSQ
jgi:hypothetical protein